MKVTAPPYSSQHGDYLISGDFKGNPRTPSVVLPAQALVKGNIPNIEPMSLQDDKYLVLQGCASAECRKASLVRFSIADNISGKDSRSNRVRMTLESRYFIWLKCLPEVSGQSCGQGWLMFSHDTTQDGSHFCILEQISPPLTLIPTGELVAFHEQVMQLAERRDPVRVARESHEGSTYVVTYDGGSIMRVQRMHATR